MKLMPLNTECYGTTHIGYVRTNNEDVWAYLPEKQFYILADGMGGHKAGEVASQFAVDQMCSLMQARPEGMTVEETCRYLREAMSKSNTRVFDASHSQPDYAGMGTTLSCFTLVGNFLVYGHIGDSRLYRYRNRLQQLTEDHSLRQSAIAREEDAASSHLLRNVITRAIGTHSGILPDIGVISVHPGDIYLLCSDGLSDYVPGSTISQILGSDLSLEEMGEMLVQSALEKGGNDNITVLLVKIAP